MTDVDKMAIKAKDNHNILNQLIHQSELFIMKCTSKVSRRYITKSDDEWSIALNAFTQAVSNYELHKGSFLKFAELVIHRRLVDHYRTQAKYHSEILVNPAIFNSEFDEYEDENTSTIALSFAISEKVSQRDSTPLKLEIETANEIFSFYGFTFMDLSTCSPRARKTKSSCAKATSFLLRNPLLIEELRGAKQLPLKIIEKNTKIPRKILERHRKYIIAAVEILSGEYPYLAEYMQYIREEMGK